MARGDGYWFRPKRFGFGATPDSWQGWAVTLLFAAALMALARFTPHRIAIAVGIPLVPLFLILCWKKTRGGWRWRWGGD